MWSSFAQWLGSALSGPAANLLSGLIGAIVGVVGLFIIQGLQTKTSEREARAAARLIYLEIAYNIAAIQGIAMAPVGIPLLISTGEWERHSQKLTTITPEHDIGRIARPYLELNALRVIFAQPWYYMAVSRLKDADLDALKKMSDGFRDAEAALRPMVWTGQRLTGLTEAMQVKGDPFAPRSMRRRMQLARSDVPIGFLTTVGVAAFGVRGLLWVMDTIRGWFGRENK